MRAIVSGATGGLGGAVVEELVDAGFSVVALGHEPAPSLAPSPSPSKVTTVTCNLTDEVEAARVVGEIVAGGAVDALVNLVGGFAMGQPIAQLDTSVWRRMMQLNLDAAFFLCRAVLPAMLARGQGSIVCVGSRSALEPQTSAAAYAVSKAALVALVRNLDAEVRTSGINVNCILPSIIDTPANRAAMPGAHPPWPTPCDIARVIRFLVSKDARIISGAAIPVFGQA